MQCRYCSRTETLRVRSVPQGRALPFALCLGVGAGMGSVFRPPERCCLRTSGSVKETESVAFPLWELKGFREGQSCWKSLGCAWKYCTTAGQSRGRGHS